MSRIKVALDFCVSPRFVAVLQELYGHAGYEFLHLSKLVAAQTEDPVWADRYKRFGGKIVLSGDCKIAYKPHEAVAFVDNGFISFFPEEIWSGLRLHEKAAHLVYWWPKIVRIAQDAEAGTCWRIPCRGKKGDLKLHDCEMHPLVIPDSTLDKARRRRA